MRKIFLQVISSTILMLPQSKAAPVAEALMGHFTTVGALNIQVRSGGCTLKKHFSFRKDFVGEVSKITFYRSHQDPCRARIPYGEILTFSFGELGFKAGDEIQVGNSNAAIYISQL